MRSRAIWPAVLLLMVATPCAAHAQGNGLACSSKTLTVAQSPAQVPIMFDPGAIGPACVDDAGHATHLTAVSPPATLTRKTKHSPNVVALSTDIPEGGSVTLSFTVADDRGQSATATVTVVHATQPQS